MLTESEIALGGLIIALLSGGGGVIWSGRYKVSKAECSLKHEGMGALLDEKLKTIKEDIKEIKDKIK